MIQLLIFLSSFLFKKLYMFFLPQLEQCQFFFSIIKQSYQLNKFTSLTKIQNANFIKVKILFSNNKQIYFIIFRCANGTWWACWPWRTWARSSSFPTTSTPLRSPSSNKLIRFHQKNLYQNIRDHFRQSYFWLKTKC